MIERQWKKEKKGKRRCKEFIEIIKKLVNIIEKLVGKEEDKNERE